MCPTDKAANNIAFICKKYYVQVLLKELGLLNNTSNTYQQVNDKIPSGVRFIISGKKCINKQLSKYVTSAFKLCYSQIDEYDKKTYFSGAKTFWVIQNNSLPLECVNKINKRKNVKQISTSIFQHYIQRYLMINCLIFYIKL